MAYEATSTYSGILEDQNNLLDAYLTMQDQMEVAPESTDTPDVEELQEENENTPEDYEFLKNFYDESQAKLSLDEDEQDLSFLESLFEGDNKYRSYSPSTLRSNNWGLYGAPTGSFRDSISARESGGNYGAVSPNSSARGKYQFIWSIHKDKIAQQTGVKSEQEFLNNPQAQEEYFNYWDQTVLSPSADANYAAFKQYYPNATPDDVKRATHFAGRGGLEKAIKTGNFTQGIDANNTSIQKYVFRQYGGGDEIKQADDSKFSWYNKLKNKFLDTPIGEDFQNQYPTSKEKLSAITEGLTYLGGPITKVGASLLNLGLDVVDINEGDSGIAILSNVAKMNAKGNAMRRIGSAAAGIYDDIINPKEEVKKKK